MQSTLLAVDRPNIFDGKDDILLKSENKGISSIQSIKIIR